GGADADLETRHFAGRCGKPHRAPRQRGRSGHARAAGLAAPVRGGGRRGRPHRRSRRRVAASQRRWLSKRAAGRVASVLAR
ncbi:MAG: hypothetical protein RLZZ479_1155, partial [Bacteroidota bacterium]